HEGHATLIRTARKIAGPEGEVVVTVFVNPLHALLPIPRKGTSDWGYAWVPVVGPLIGGALSGLVFNAAF
ncbi:pantoate--beta-alanine ligase, partial [Streptomyces albogriseolus]|uniref:pantoate--beta-alanine ligase n=1 Tax=Streptomyces albogriseolus TaxID=1887 RepID=UPI003460490C